MKLERDSKSLEARDRLRRLRQESSFLPYMISLPSHRHLDKLESLRQLLPDVVRSEDLTDSNVERLTAFLRLQFGLSEGEAGELIQRPAGTSMSYNSIDEIERYLRIRNHAVFIYTAEDAVLWSYVLEFWNELDALSGDWCDIHPSRAHLDGKESGYDFLRPDSTIPGMRNIRRTALPCLHIWSDHESLTISFDAAAPRERITQSLRSVFDELQCCPDGLDANGSRRIRQSLETLKVSKSDRRTDDLMAMLMLAGILLSIVIVALVGFRALGIWTGFGAVVGAAVLYGVFGALMLRYVGQITEHGMLELIAMSFSFGIRGIARLSGARHTPDDDADQRAQRHGSEPRHDDA